MAGGGWRFNWVHLLEQCETCFLLDEGFPQEFFLPEKVAREIWHVTCLES